MDPDRMLLFPRKVRRRYRRLQVAVGCCCFVMLIGIYRWICPGLHSVSLVRLLYASAFAAQVPVIDHLTASPAQSLFASVCVTAGAESEAACLPAESLEQ